jgi:hypothetical protein
MVGEWVTLSTLTDQKFGIQQKRFNGNTMCAMSVVWLGRVLVSAGSGRVDHAAKILSSELF